MKRHEALAPLSREHHNALILAQLLKKGAPAYRGMPADTEGKVSYAANFFTTDLIEHFRKEEAVLEKVRHVNEQIAGLADEIIAEHKMLSDLFTGLETAKDKIAALDETGRLLEAHVRKEERVLFPLIEKHCGEELLSQL